MLLANPRSWFSRDFVISRGGVEVAEVVAAWFRERAELRVAGEAFVFGRESFFGGTFALRHGEDVLARAQKMFWRRGFVVEFAGRSLELKAIHFWGREYGVFENGRELGTVGPTGWFGREYAVELPESVPLPMQVFLFWLVIVLRRRANSHSHSTPAGA